MNNIFLRLYFLIVISILIVGVCLDFAWQKFDDNESINQHDDLMLKIVALQLGKMEYSQLKNHLKQVNQYFPGKFSLLSPEMELSQTVSLELEANQTVFIQSSSEFLGFTSIQNHEQFLLLNIAMPSNTSSLKYIFVGLFYSLIAIVVFYWIWPLSKDLNRLEKAVHQFDQQQWQSKVELPATSSIAHLARAYNALLDKIKLLVETQQAMSHSISHELRTPLARIRFSLQMAEESKDLSQIHFQLRSITDDISEMNELINELLSFASLEKTTASAKIEKGNVAQLIKTLILRLTKNYPSKEIIFETDLDDTEVMCDSYLMERAIQNLVVNACKFANTKVIINYSVDSLSYIISVNDDGLGIDKNQRSVIFDSFVQIGNDKKNSGFGLGLAIVKRIMTLHNGTAKADTADLGGAKFMLSWPR